MDTVIQVSGSADAIGAVAGLLRSLGLSDAKEILPLAARLADAEAGTEAARRRAVAKLGAWFARQMRQPDLDPETAFLAGRAAFLALGAAERWPDVLLNDTPPRAFVAGLTAAAPRLCPIVSPTPMVAQPLHAPELIAPLAGLIRLPGKARAA